MMCEANCEAITLVPCANLTKNHQGNGNRKRHFTPTLIEALDGASPRELEYRGERAENDSWSIFATRDLGSAEAGYIGSN